MIAVNCLIPYMPRLDMVKVPPWNSLGCSLPSLAFSANLALVALIARRPCVQNCAWLYGHIV